MLVMKQRSNRTRARHALVKEIVMYVIGINVLQWIILFLIPGKRNVKSTSFDEKNLEGTFVFINIK